MIAKLKFPIFAAFVVLVVFVNSRYLIPSRTPSIQDAKHGTTVGDVLKTWDSNYHPVHLHLPDGWTLIRPFLDTATTVTVGMANANTSQSLVIKITPDVSEELVSADLYRDALIQQMVAATDGNKFIDETREVFQGVEFNRMRFLMHNRKLDSIACQNLFVRRTGKKNIACQVNYPVKTERDLEMPLELVMLLKQIRLTSNE